MPERSPYLLSRAASLPREGLVLVIRAYQVTVAPVLPALLGAGCGCQFTPSCSHYAVQALRERGLLVGAALSAWRILRCNPFTGGGSDPVPPRRPICTRVTA